MANNRDIKLDEYGISKYAYRELNNYCLQYAEKKNRGDTSDTMQIEKTAHEAAPDIHSYLLIAVTQKKSYLNLRMMHNIPCCEKYFNISRRRFYYLLAKKRGMI